MLWVTRGFVLVSVLAGVACGDDAPASAKAADVETSKRCVDVRAAFLLPTGCRRGEALGLTWADLCLEAVGRPNSHRSCSGQQMNGVACYRA